MYTDEFDGLQEIWLAQPVWRVPDDEELLAAVKKESAAFEARVNSRDWGELLAGLTLALLFVIPDQRPEGPEWARFATVALVVAAPLYAYIGRLRQPRESWPQEGTLRAALDRLVSRHRVQERLLRTVTWWYLLPMAAAGALYCYYHYGVTFAHFHRHPQYFYMLFVIFLFCYRRYVARQTHRLQLERLFDQCRRWDRLEQGEY